MSSSLSAFEGPRASGGSNENVKEVRVFQSGLDMSSLTVTVFSQPSLYMGFANGVLMIVSQRFPEEFLPPRYLAMSYNGVRAASMLTIPFCTVAGGYLSIASVAATASLPVSGHLYGFTFSMATGLFFLSLRRVSGYFALIGVMNIAFGSFHHYRRMRVYGDNAPVFHWSDFGEIWRDMQRKRALKREKKQHIYEAKQQRELLRKG